ncbi:alpha-amylase family glycosyl hydrolase [Saccharicrinis sp. GN24d3]|uniref:alpha-amylase family glycosyl hydrolase n=1 Tax=Saccharicrinis sp. GN24d3 TaxID=3458416 RepID=UPI0040351464
MFKINETGPEFRNKEVRFRIYLPNIDKSNGFSVKVYLIDKQGQFDADKPAQQHNLTPSPGGYVADEEWGDYNKTLWMSNWIQLVPGTWLYRFEISGPSKEKGNEVRSLFFGDPCARETDAGVFSVFRIDDQYIFFWEDEDYKVPPTNDLIIYELNVAEFAGDFKGVAQKIPYLKSLGVNAIELLPVSSIAEPYRWGYIPVFYFAPEERYGGPTGLKHLVNECHKHGIAVILDVVYAHADRMFPYQIGYERFFHLWKDDHYSDADGIHRSSNPMVSKYANFARKNDWRMKSTKEFFNTVNQFWLDEYHVDGFRYDHVNGFLDRKPLERDNRIDWYSQENRPTFESLRSLTISTYNQSKNYQRFLSEADGSSNIIQISEDLTQSAYQLSPVSDSAINGNWEKGLFGVVSNMATYNYLSEDLCSELLLSDQRFDKAGYKSQKAVGNDTIQSHVIQYIESHDDSRLLYLIEHGHEVKDSGFDFQHGLDELRWWKLQPYAIALMTGVGIPMLWAGQEFAENYGMAHMDMTRIRGYRPLHWDYFYNVSALPSTDTVLPLTTLYRHLGKLRNDYPSLKGTREYAKQEYCSTSDQVIVYRRWNNQEVILVVLNFSDHEQYAPVPFGHTGRWTDILDSSYKGSQAFAQDITDPTSLEWISIPGNFGRVMCLRF